MKLVVICAYSFFIAKDKHFQDKLPNSKLSLLRNPDYNNKKASTPWCFIHFETNQDLLDAMKNKEHLYEDCETTDKICSEDELVCPKTYQGKTDITRSGYACKKWTDVVLSIRPSDEVMGDVNMTDNHNFCRYIIVNNRM